MVKPLQIALTALVLGAATLLAPAQIKEYSLREMVMTADGAVHGQIINSVVFRVDSEIDGPELYFTTLTIEGTELNGGRAVTLDVTFAGGFVDEENGVHNSEAPSDDDIKIGNVVVAFYKWSDNMGGDVAANALYASHGGLYRTVDGPTGTVVLGRGEGYAIESNKSVEALATAIQSIVVEHR
jgi:hypothetical protein